MTLYRIIYYDQEALRNGAKTEPVNYVGSHPLTWHESDVPEVGFVELTLDEIKTYLQEQEDIEEEECRKLIREIKC
jgi:hypothetical protein